MPDMMMAQKSRYYIELSRAAEHLHRRFLDVLRIELNRLGIRELNTVQALLLANIGDSEISMRQLVERGYYQPSVISYHIRKLGDLGYLDVERSSYDKRSVNIRTTEKARAVVAGIAEIERSLDIAKPEDGIADDTLQSACHTLRQVERLWTDYIRDAKSL
jgi:DNA-binding MarR family transcriptional regulator